MGGQINLNDTALTNKKQKNKKSFFCFNIIIMIVELMNVNKSIRKQASKQAHTHAHTHTHTHTHTMIVVETGY